MRQLRLSLCLTLICLSVSPVHLAPIGPKCQNRLDLVFVIDSTSSESAPKFADVKAQVKGIVSRFEIGKDSTRLGLITASSRAAQVVARFNDINSLSDFNSALDRVNFDSSGPVDLAEGIRVARDSVLSSAPRTKVSKILVVVKDRRWQQPDPADAQVRRDRVQSEASRVKSSGTAVQAVGIGGIWTRDDLAALFGTDYLLFKSTTKAAASIKSLNNLICQADCPDNGKSLSKSGLCFSKTKLAVNTKVAFTMDSNRLSVCRKEIGSSFERCSEQSKCTDINKDIGSCNKDGKLTVRVSWQSYDYKTMQCINSSDVAVVACEAALKCTGQLADVIFILDMSSSMHGLFHHVKEATRILMEPLDIGPGNAHVALMTFHSQAEIIADLREGSHYDRAMAARDRLPNDVPEYGNPTNTHLALDMAIQEFRRNGRSGVPRFVILLTDGLSLNPGKTFQATAAIKNYGVTVYAVGIGNIYDTELKRLTEPESDTNMILLKKLNQLDHWATEFAKRICNRIAAPKPKLCEDSVFVQAISECFNGKQQITRTEYKFDSSKLCVKTVKSTIEQSCRSKCIDPLNGNEYFEGDRWKTRCHEFYCFSTPVEPFLPVKSECVSASGTCHAVNSAATFKCIDEKGVTADNCRCMGSGGKPVLVIDSY